MIWESNLNFIEKHNLAADRGEHTFWVGMNEYGDMVRLSSITRGAYVLGWHERVWRYGKAIFYNPLSIHLGWPSPVRIKTMAAVNSYNIKIVS